MDFDDFQQRAKETDQFQARLGDDGLMIPLLGLSGEVGSLLAEFKKKIRDNGKYEEFSARAAEELGDMLWYMSNVASRLGLQLSTIASQNLTKTQERWPLGPEEKRGSRYFDADFSEAEQLPRKLLVTIREPEPGLTAQMHLEPGGNLFGEKLNDNARDNDGYRFHDVMHLGHLAVLGWSPVLRSLLKRKRKSDKEKDEVDDGARALILEEAIIAFVYSNAERHSFYEHSTHVPTDMLITIKSMVRHLEVGSCTMKEWEQCILQSYSIFRHLKDHGSATVEIDVDSGTIKLVRKLKRASRK